MIAAIVQARTGSTRLPGKALLPLGGMPSVLQVLRRVKAIEACHEVVLATTDLPEDDELAQVGDSAGYRVFRGSSQDVLGRFDGAAKSVQAETVVRITADCPLLDPHLCSELIEQYAVRSADYASIDKAFGWPQGLDCEVFSRESLENAARAASSQYDREHVTPWIQRHARHPFNLPGPGSEACWVLDTGSDYEHLKSLYGQLKPQPYIPGWAEVLAADGRIVQ